ncbi:MAG TPA: 3,4-dihydroxy-2-butanone-4-phosphate synthase, partial [Rhizobiales bacterium]|nr:3,4-dihydroxy-2-butanone-4-phosphate synthase [Hyphomicrobiales bacterium]
MNLAQWLKKTGTTQAALGKMLGITQGRVSQLVKGAAPSFELAGKIEQVTRGKVPAQEFYGDDMTDEEKNQLDSVESAIQAIRDGELIVVVDDDDRENEGDLIGAASKITPDQMAFIIRHTSGIVCAPMTSEDSARLKLDPMVAANDCPNGTAFTISVDYREGLTTGISAAERCATVHALANSNVQAGDFVRPGHVFPLVAKSGGVLMRSGHTEAAVDITRLAGEPPVGVISELVNDDGTVKRGRQVLEFARAHNLKIISVDAMIAYRQSRERLVEQAASFEVETAMGPARAHAFTTPFEPVQHLALVFGEIGDGREIPVRLHRENVIDDVFGDGGMLAKTYDVFREKGRGILVYLREGTTGVPASRLEDAFQ